MLFRSWKSFRKGSYLFTESIRSFESIQFFEVSEVPIENIRYISQKVSNPSLRPKDRILSVKIGYFSRRIGYFSQKMGYFSLRIEYFTLRSNTFGFGSDTLRIDRILSAVSINFKDRVLHFSGSDTLPYIPWYPVYIIYYITYYLLYNSTYSYTYTRIIVRYFYIS